MRRSVLFGFLLTVYFCALLVQAQQPPNGNEKIPSDEPARIQRITDIFAQHMTSAFKSGDPWLRNAHGKQHGCVKAYLKVKPNLPPQLAQGIFSQPKTYPAFVRFSNGAGRGFSTVLRANEPDQLPDTRGIAIKILSVVGKNLSSVANTQDFLLTTSRNGFIPDGPTAEDFFTAIFNGPGAAAAFLASNPRIAFLFAKIGVDGSIANPLTATYWQQVPSRFGSRAAKFRLLPCNSNSDAIGGQWREPVTNFLARTLQQAFNTTGYKGSICFDFAVQFFESDATTPIEDATVQWDTPWYSVGTLDFITDQGYAWGSRQDEFCRHLNFNPWNSIAEHQPLGAIQRIRRSVYEKDGLRRWSFKGQSSTPPSLSEWNSYGSL